MRRKEMIFALSISIPLLAILAFQASMRPKGPGGPGPPPEFRMGPDGLMEAEWVHLSFEMDLTDRQMIKLRGIYREARLKLEPLRRRLRMSGRNPETVRSVMEEMERIRSELHKRLRDVLTPEQIEDLLRWEEGQRRFPPPPRERRR